MLVDTPNESWDSSTSIWLFSCEKHVTVKVALKTEAAETRSSDSMATCIFYQCGNTGRGSFFGGGGGLGGFQEEGSADVSS